MPHPALDLLAAKAKLAGAVIVGMAVAGGMSGGALSLVADASGTPDPVVASASAEPTESAEPTDSPEPTESPDAKESEAPEAVEPSATADATQSAAAATSDVMRVVLNHATVVSISPTSLVVTAAGATTTWTLSPDTHWTGAIKDPAQITPGMVIHLRGTKTGDVYTATHVVTPGNNKPHHVKTTHTKPARTTHSKPAKKAHGKQH